MLKRTPREESLYHLVAEFIGRSGSVMERKSIEQQFADIEPKRIGKALENASHRRLIHCVGKGLYKAGPKPAFNACGRDLWPSQNELDAMARAILPAALNSRTPIENAWFRVARMGGGSAMSA